MSKKLTEIKENIQRAKACGSLQVAKKVELAEKAVDGAIELISELLDRVNSLENLARLEGWQE